VKRRLLMLVAAAMCACFADVISETEAALAGGDFTKAEAIVHADRTAHGVTPEMLEAASWIARADLAAKRFDAAEAQAKEVRTLCAAELQTHPVDSSPSLATALGASIEVRAQAMAAHGERAPAVAYLQREFASFSKTSVAARIRKNINLLALVGHPAPTLDVAHSIGAQPPSLASLHGRPVLLFFWAHWCGDCKADEPTIAKLAREYEPRGLALIAPTQLYGYTAQSDTASPDEELAWTRRVFDRFYSDLPGVSVPVSAADFRSYGASTVPTIVVIDRAGIVRLYHPGAMTESELRPELERVAGTKAESGRQ
jgi:thiol-disulfide isomerase/thioredoxin